MDKLAYQLGRSFVKFSNRGKTIYGPMNARRKAELAGNAAQVRSKGQPALATGSKPTQLSPIKNKGTLHSYGKPSR